jgi:hypothetical protein
MTVDRRSVLGLGLGLLAGAACGRRSREGDAVMNSSTRRMPVLFVGHGSPMNAIEDNAWARGFRQLGQDLPIPRAILAVSAHWYVPATLLTANERPETIHDLGGFPPAQFEVQYPARGNPELARRVVTLVEDRHARLADDWGLDHGTWSVLVHVRPGADVPVIQLSIDRRACRRRSWPACSRRSSPPSRSASAPGSACRSATASSPASPAPSTSTARSAAAPPSASCCRRRGAS